MLQEKNSAYQDGYLPVDPDFIDHCVSCVSGGRSGKIHYWNPENEVDDASGKLVSLEKSEKGFFLKLEDGSTVRLDKIITLFGRPGPGYEAYDRYANVCLTCEDLGQF